MRTRDPFNLALQALRTALLSGVGPGLRVPINDAAAVLGLSTSPVREALSRLCGEGLVEDRRGLGYFTRSLPVEDLVGLVRLERLHVELALELCGDARPEGPGPTALRSWISDLMERCPSEPLRESHARIAARLIPVDGLLGEPASADGDLLGEHFAVRIASAEHAAIRLRRLQTDPLESFRKTV